MLNLNFNPFPTLETDRLILRKLKMSDAKPMFRYRSNKENFKFVDMPIYTSIEEAKNNISKKNKGVENNKWIIWAITDKDTDKILGTISIWNISKEKLKGELGYGLFPGNLGKGIMSEALRKVVEYGFNNIGFKTIEAYTGALNERSIKLLERNNFSKVFNFIETETFNDNPFEMVIYKRLCED